MNKKLYCIYGIIALVIEIIVTIYICTFKIKDPKMKFKFLLSALWGFIVLVGTIVIVA